MRILEKLKEAILDEDFYLTNEILEKISREENSFSYVKEILEIMEANPDLDYGMPGPVVHFMEKYYKHGYESLLLESVKKCPTRQTLWMINRIINDPLLTDRGKYMEALTEVSHREDVVEDIRNEAKGFLCYQQNM